MSSTSEVAATSASEANVGMGPSIILLAAVGRSVARGRSVLTPSMMLLTDSLGRASLTSLLAAARRSVTSLTVLEVAAGRSRTSVATMLETVPERSSTDVLVGRS